MSSKRTKIRNLVTQLLTNTTAAKSNVFPSRAIALRTDNLPALTVHTDSEDRDDQESFPKIYKVNLSLTVAVHVEDGNNEEEAAQEADAIAQQVEDIMHAQDANTKSILGCEVDSISMTSANMDHRPQGETTVTTCQLNFNIEYYLPALTEDMTENEGDFEKAQVGWDIGTANDPDTEAEDIITIG